MSDDTTSAVPKPGSPEAVDKGCQCPVMDNNNGNGLSVNGGKQWWISSQCPIHAGKQDEAKS